MTVRSTPIDLDAMIRGYAECALWSSLDDDEQPLDERYSIDDIDRASLAAMREDCADFVRLVADTEHPDDLDRLEPGQIGQDFWLTRNGHGAGFWDRGLGARGDRLTRWANSYGSCDLYFGDDGKVYAA
jgi:hypothetical protein